ncbi:MAG: HAD-IIB family hydrolase [Dehalococcoidales bacterium]|nr:HAD-IIB family hydrolase [Dehalococcoidales bacterium]
MKQPKFRKLPRAIAIDLDGTLLNSSLQISSRNIRALKTCFAANIPVILATARAERGVRRLCVTDVLDKCSLVLSNGAIVKGVPPLSGFHKQQLASGLTRKIVDLVRNYDSNVRITIEIEGLDFGTDWQWDPVSLWETNSATPDMVISIDEAIAREPMKVSVAGVGKNLIGLIEELRKELKDKIAIIPSENNTFLNIVDPMSSKPNALRKLLEPQGISLNEVLAFGDDFPDVDMLKECGISVAMANAFPEVKAVCKYETASNDEDGVAQVLEKLLSTIM